MVVRYGMLLAAVLFVVFLTIPAQSHEWYDADCCNKQDCAPVLKAKRVRISQHGQEPVSGWEVTTKHGTGVFFDTQPAGDLRVSKDNQMHACILNVEGYQYVRCLYIPNTL